MLKMLLNGLMIITLSVTSLEIHSKETSQSNQTKIPYKLEESKDSEKEKKLDLKPKTKKEKHFIPYKREGNASYYANQFHGRKTASGEVFNMHKMTAASNQLPLGSYAKVTCSKTGKSVIVKINDTGGFHKYGRIIDLSYGAAKSLGMIDRGVTRVTVERVKSP